MNYLVDLQCSYCGETYDADGICGVCQHCGKPLLARYDLSRLRTQWRRDCLVGRTHTLWRFREVLPIRSEENEISLGEGGTPLLRASQLSIELGVQELFVKDEGLNPTGSFKARGLCVAISRAKELGVEEVVIPSAGNAAGAMCAYAARAAMRAHVFMPRSVPLPIKLECMALGGEVTLVDGTIADCGEMAKRASAENGWLNLSTLKEPYRIEGKKTMGYELAEDLDWELPDVIIYPTGGGTGLIGMCKAFDEMEALGWIGPERPRMVVVQADGCAPMVRAFQRGEQFASLWEGAATIAAGLCVPAAIGDFLILQAVRKSCGTAVSVSEEALLAGQAGLARVEGVLACPEGGATLAALRALVRQGWIHPKDRVVLFNTGTGISYPSALEKIATN